MPFNYAVAQSIINAERTIVRAVDLTSPCRYFATRDSAGFITLPTLDPGASYVELQGIQSISYNKSDRDNKIRLLGDEGWEDSKITGFGWQASVQGFFMKDSEIPAGQVCPAFRGNYEEGFRLIERGRRTGDREIYVEILTELGQLNGTSGNWIYDFTGVNVSIQNVKPDVNPENMLVVSYDMIGRGAVITGLYDAGSTPLSFGNLQSGLLTTAPSSGTRRYAVSPVDNSVGFVTTANATVTYTTDGTTAMTQLALGQTDGSGFRLEVASTGVAVPCTVSLSTNVVTIDPTPTLAAATVYRLVVRDGAITQAVDANGNPSGSGTRRPMQGFTTTFRTA